MGLRGPARRRWYAGAAALAVSALLASGCSSASSGSTGGGDSNNPVSCTGTKPTVYMIGSVTNSTTWQAIQNGFVQGGQDFCLHAIYSAPNSHTNTDEIGLISAALASHPAG